MNKIYRNIGKFIHNNFSAWGMEGKTGDCAVYQVLNKLMKAPHCFDMQIVQHVSSPVGHKKLSRFFNCAVNFK